MALAENSALHGPRHETSFETESSVLSRSHYLSNRVYYAPHQKLSSSERECVQAQLTGISAGAVPARNTMVNYTFWLSAQRARFWGKIQP